MAEPEKTDELPELWASATPKVVCRDEWGALPPKQKLPLTHPVSNIVFTFTGTEECNNVEDCAKAVQALQQRDMIERRMSDVQFNFLVGGDANIYEGRGWHTRPTKEEKHAHVDDNCITIAYIGDFAEKDPSEEVTRARSLILYEGFANKYITDTVNITPYRIDGDSSEDTIPYKTIPSIKATIKSL